MKKMLMTISASLACCVFFDASCSSAPLVPELTPQERMKVIAIMTKNQMARTYSEANNFIETMGPECMRELIQQSDLREDRRKTESEDFAAAQLEQAKENVEHEFMLQMRADQEKLDRETIEQILNEETLKQQQELEDRKIAEESATEDLLLEETEKQDSIDPETLMLLTQLQYEGQTELSGITGQRLINLREHLTKLDNKYHRGFLQLLESGNAQQLASNLSEFNPYEEPDAGNALNIILG